MSNTPVPVVRAQSRHSRDSDVLAQQLRDAPRSRKGRRTLRAAVQRLTAAEAAADAAAVDAAEERRQAARAKAKRARAARRATRRR